MVQCQLSAPLLLGNQLTIHQFLCHNLLSSSTLLTNLQKNSVQMQKSVIMKGISTGLLPNDLVGLIEIMHTCLAPQRFILTYTREKAGTSVQVSRTSISTALWIVEKCSIFFGVSCQSSKLPFAAKTRVLSLNEYLKLFSQQKSISSKGFVYQGLFYNLHGRRARN